MIYLDHAAATPLSNKAQKAMEPYFSDQFFNPSAPYLPAVHTRQTYEQAKETIAQSIGAKSLDLTITSGATESINLAFSVLSTDSKNHCIISAVEHPAVLACAQAAGNYETIKVDKTGRIILQDLAKKITQETKLISICLASSELGTIQPIPEVAALVKKVRAKRLSENNPTPLYLHCDASQGLGLLDIKVSRLGADLLTINSAKIYGPKGIGALWSNRNIPLSPIIHGGGQENNLRSGTENVPALIGFATAIQEATKNIPAERERLQALTTQLRKELSTIKNLKFLGNPKNQLANFLPISIPNLDAERLIFKLEQKELYLKTMQIRLDEAILPTIQYITNKATD